MNFQLKTGDKKIKSLQHELGRDTWPAFMQHDPIVEKYWPKLYSDFLRFQFALFDGDNLIGVGNSVPLNWQGSLDSLPITGLDWSMGKAIEDSNKDYRTNLLVGLQILINPLYQGKGLSYEFLKIMKSIAKNNGFKNIALPVRPTFKSLYPLVAMEKYIRWTNPSGEAFDPWIRMHIKAGGIVKGICKESMTIIGTISEWEEWTTLKFQSTDDYVIKDALVPVNMNVEQNIGRYVEPNLWIIHKTI